MQIFWIRTESGEDFWGPYTDRSLADRVLKIACMAGHEDVEVAVMECDEDLGRIVAGLLPWRIIAELEDGKLMKTTCTLTWPPEAQEGIIRGEADDTGEEAKQIEYFVWSKTENEAKRRLAQLSVPKAESEAS